MNVLMIMVAVHRNASTHRAPIFAAVEIDSHSLLTEQDALMMMVCHLVFLMYLRLLISYFLLIYLLLLQ